MTGIDPAAIATEVRLGKLSRENAATKALRLLVSSRVMILLPPSLPRCRLAFLIHTLREPVTQDDPSESSGEA